MICITANVNNMNLAQRSNNCIHSYIFVCVYTLRSLPYFSYLVYLQTRNVRFNCRWQNNEILTHCGLLWFHSILSSTCPTNVFESLCDTCAVKHPRIHIGVVIHMEIIWGAFRISRFDVQLSSTFIVAPESTIRWTGKSPIFMIAWGISPVAPRSTTCYSSRKLLPVAGSDAPYTLRISPWLLVVRLLISSWDVFLRFWSFWLLVDRHTRVKCPSLRQLLQVMPSAGQQGF